MQLVSSVSLITVRPVLVQLIKHYPLSGQFHIWCRCCLQVPQQTRFGLNMQSSSGIDFSMTKSVTSARSPLPLITYIVPVFRPMHFFRLVLIRPPTQSYYIGGNMTAITISRSEGCGGRIRVLRQEAAGHSLLCSKLLRGV